MKTTTRESQPAATQPVAEQYTAPVVNVYESPDGYELQADMPGVTKEALQITLDGSELVITGRREREAVSGEPLLRERVAWDYRRVFELDPAIDTAKVSARMEQGVLTLTLPKSERVKPRAITID